MRKILVHIHLFKNAGTSVDQLLRESFGGQWRSVDGPHPWSLIRADELERLIATDERLVALSSHQVRPPLPQRAGWEIFPVVFLRHPIDRAGSVCFFERKTGFLKKEMRTAEYIRWRLSEGGPVIRNFQTACLSTAAVGHADQRKVRARPEHLGEAKTFLQSLSAFGLVEKFDASMQRLVAVLGREFPQLQLRAVRSNESRAGGIGERITELQREIGQELSKELLEANALDMELYEFARTLFGKTGSSTIIGTIEP
jgi:hypothetical protein